uniref:Uncharacterized protein n=1 Tax=Rhizophora mucronata TaxID=61149 RepID=A0A2P2PIY6_RHIMU
MDKNEENTIKVRKMLYICNFGAVVTNGITVSVFLTAIQMVHFMCIFYLSNTQV